MITATTRRTGRALIALAGVCALVATSSVLATASSPVSSGGSGLALIVNTASCGQSTIALPLEGDVHATINWGDGSLQQVNAPGNASHTYSASGTFSISITGVLSQFGDGINSYPGASCITAVSSFGPNGLAGLTSLSGAFNGATNLAAVPPALPSSVTDLSYAFRNATSINDQNLSSWNVSHVTTFGWMFDGATQFNQPLSSWDTGKVFTFHAMFAGATSFNQPLSSWDTSSVTDMGRMFDGATRFDQPLSSWDTGKVFYMDSMFDGASRFNRSLANWSTNALGSADGFLNQSALDAMNYDDLLNAWGNRPEPHGVIFTATGVHYGASAAAARATLVNTSGWKITDGGQLSSASETRSTSNTTPASTPVSTPTTGTQIVLTTGGITVLGIIGLLLLIIGGLLGALLWSRKGTKAR